MDYKKAKEDFVSNLQGTDTWDIFLATTSWFAGIILLDHLYLARSIFTGNDAPLDMSRLSHFLLALLLETVCLIVPSVLALTVCADSNLYLTLALLAVSILIAFVGKAFKKDAIMYEWRKWGDMNFTDFNAMPRKRHQWYLSAYRSGMMVCTCVCILAVDFKVFPRKFAKTETYGTGLMDLGVGSFIFSSALVSKLAGSHLVTWGKMMQTFVPCIVLGAGRVIFQKSADYQLHVSEYGVHWNFFFTIATISMAAYIMSPLGAYQSPFVSGGTLILAYQTLLTYNEVVDFILNAARNGIFTSNREGIISCVGYYSLHLLGVGVGEVLPGALFKQTLAWWYGYIKGFVFAVVIVWLLHLSLDQIVQKSSRRMVNITYSAWVVGHNLTLVLMALLIQIMRKRVNPTPMIDVITKHQLLFFLVANVITGLVNMNMETIHTPDRLALIVLSLYIFAVLVVTLLWDRVTSSRGSSSSKSVAEVQKKES